MSITLRRVLNISNFVQTLLDTTVSEDLSFSLKGIILGQKKKKKKEKLQALYFFLFCYALDARKTAVEWVGQNAMRMLYKGV